MEQQPQYIETLLNIYNSNPDAQQLDIEFQSIVDMTPLLPLLQQFRKLKELSFHGNRLKSLPEDLSVLPSLQILDISNNLISNFQDLIPPLQSLPNLINLSISIKSMEDQLFLQQNLPNLQILNGQVINQNDNINNNDDNNHIQHQQQQEQSFNNDQQMQQQQEQQQYDSEDQQQQQHMQSSSFDQQDEFQQSQQSDMQGGSGGEITLKQEDLETVAILYDQIRLLFRETKTGNDQELAEQFDNHVKVVMMDLSMKLKENNNDFLINNNVLKAKYELFEICFNRSIELLNKVDPRVVQIVQTLHDQHAQIFEGYNQQLEKSGSQVLSQNSSQQQQLQHSLENLNLSQKQQVILEQFKQENEDLRQQLANVEEENKKYLDIIIKRNKGDNTQKQNFEETQPQQQQHQQSQSQLQNNSIYTSNSSPNRQQQPNQQQQQMNYSQSKYLSNQSKLMQSMQNSVVAAGNLPAVRTLSIRQMKEVIEEIYLSKQKFDQKYMEAKLPRETMEQHMYTYLNQKYGLKSLIIEWATAIINGIRKFSQEDNDIAVFGKILRNENDEEFRFVQSQVKNTIAELLKMYLRGRYPFKHNSEIKEMLVQKINGWVFEEEATDIIKYMYSQEDAEQLIEKLRNRYQVHNQRSEKELKKMTREEQLQLLQEKEKLKIQYFEFQKIILDFQLKSHEKFLKKFISMFRQCDGDNNGVVDENEFRQLLENMGENLGEEKTQKFLNTVDPYNHQQITFSQCVTLFSSEVVQGAQGQQISMLQKIAMDGQELTQQ